MIHLDEGIIRSSRGKPLSVSVCDPDGEGPLAILVHGFKSDRSEDGRYDELAVRLAQKGCHVIMMDLPGCGQSEETLMDFTISNCLDDVESCLNYILEKYPIRKDRFFLVGYSLGGRIISLFLNRHPEVSALVFWAGCNQPFTENDQFLQQDIGMLRKQGRERGYYDFYDIFTGQTDQFPVKFIDEMIELDALAPLRQFSGRALVIQGDRDTTIDQDNARMIYDSLTNARERKLEIIEGADHLFGLYDGRKQDSETVISLTAEFLGKDFR